MIRRRLPDPRAALNTNPQRAKKQRGRVPSKPPGFPYRAVVRMCGLLFYASIVTSLEAFRGRLRVGQANIGSNQGGSNCCEEFSNISPVARETMARRRFEYTQFPGSDSAEKGSANHF